MDILTSIHGRRVGLGPNAELILNKPNGGQTLVGAYVDKIITSAQVLALFGTPVEVIAAPGAGKIIVPLRMQLYKPAGTAYGGIATGEDLVLKYTNAAGAQCSGVVEATGFLDQATAQSRFVGMQASTGATASDVNGVANAAVVLHMLVGEVTTGDTVLVARVWYDIISSTLPVA